MSQSRQLPSQQVAKEFGEVNVAETAAGLEIRFTILMEPLDAEGWQTGVALDGSATMKNWYGRSLRGRVPEEILAEYERKGWLTTEVQDGHPARVFAKAAHQDAIARGFLKMTDNVVQESARNFVSYLAEKLDADGGTTVIYWACGKGNAIEEVGDFTADQCRTLNLTGPAKAGFGNGTHITPAVKYFVERFADAANGMYLFLTDGRLDDLEAAKKYTTELARAIEAGRQKPVKCVLIGVGSQVDESQMEQLDDLDTGTSVDIWDHKIAGEMRDVREIFAEVVNENLLVAPSAKLYGADGALVHNFGDGLPALVKDIVLPRGSAWFELEVGQQRIRQVLQ